MALRNATAAKVLKDNADYRVIGGLALVDALAIHAAIHSTTVTVQLSSGIVLPVTISGNGCRRVDVIVDFARPKGRCKLMAQNLEKSSAAARRARLGANITHVLPLDAAGLHTAPAHSGDWGMIENGVLVKKCAAVLLNGVGQPLPHHIFPTAPPQHAFGAAESASTVRRRICAPTSLRDKQGRTYLDVPFGPNGATKDEAKRRGARWDGDAPDSLGLTWNKWYVPPDRALTPFNEWLPKPGSYAEALNAVAASGLIHHPLMSALRTSTAGVAATSTASAPIASAPIASTTAPTTSITSTSAEVTGTQTWAERDAEARKRAINLLDVTSELPEQKRVAKEEAREDSIQDARGSAGASPGGSQMSMDQRERMEANERAAQGRLHERMERSKRAVEEQGMQGSPPPAKQQLEPATMTHEVSILEPSTAERDGDRSAQTRSASSTTLSLKAKCDKLREEFDLDASLTMLQVAHGVATHLGITLDAKTCLAEKITQCHENLFASA